LHFHFISDFWRHNLDGGWLVELDQHSWTFQ
jgi:hypothetical protein